MKQHKPKKLWEPSSAFIQNSNLKKYLDWLEKRKQVRFANYQEAWRWSVEHLEDFWESIWEYFQIKSHTPYNKVLDSHKMPGAKWFEGATLNYAEHLFRNSTERYPAIIFKSERQDYVEISWSEMESQAIQIAHFLKKSGVQKGDRVAAYLPNIPEASIAFLAVCSMGAIWSSCSPDFGTSSVVDRFKQIEPKVLFAVDGYYYNGKPFERIEELRKICEQIPTIEKIVIIPYLDPDRLHFGLPNALRWIETYSVNLPAKLQFEPVPFDHPIWILYSSGTTGIPKAITHSHGGVLLEHLKYLSLHNDVHAGERFFWFTTTGWMMWNFLQASWLVGATVVLYDGSPGYPDLKVLWSFASQAKIHHFGTSAPYLLACMKQNLDPGSDFDLSTLRSIGSTGSPLPPEAFDYVYANVKDDVWLCSMAGGTDVCTAWVGGNPLLPVFEGEIQCRCLGADLHAFDEREKSLQNQVGEMVVTQPMPSMPVYFWNDPDGAKYHSSYFEMFEGIWRHGDWVIVTEAGSVIILGRSDATLNRQGVRIGTAEIYRSVDKYPEIKDSLIVNLELKGGKDFMPLFLVLNEGYDLDEALVIKIKKGLREDYSPRHVPDEIVKVPDIPMTISGKKMETPVKKILLGVPLAKAATPDSMRNPESLRFFLQYKDAMSDKM